MKASCQLLTSTMFKHFLHLIHLQSVDGRWSWWSSCALISGETVHTVGMVLKSTRTFLQCFSVCTHLCTAHLSHAETKWFFFRAWHPDIASVVCLSEQNYIFYKLDYLTMKQRKLMPPNVYLITTTTNTTNFHLFPPYSLLSHSHSLSWCLRLASWLLDPPKYNNLTKTIT